MEQRNTKDIEEVKKSSISSAAKELENFKKKYFLVLKGGIIFTLNKEQRDYVLKSLRENHTALEIRGEVISTFGFIGIFTYDKLVKTNLATGEFEYRLKELKSRVEREETEAITRNRG